jgi:hypothetical protein
MGNHLQKLPLQNIAKGNIINGPGLKAPQSKIQPDYRSLHNA